MAPGMMREGGGASCTASAGPSPIGPRSHAPRHRLLPLLPRPGPGPAPAASCSASGLGTGCTKM